MEGHNGGAQVRGTGEGQTKKRAAYPAPRHPSTVVSEE
jgi:hypothetical protein